MRKYYAILLVFFFAIEPLNANDKIKNLYILIEPTSAEQEYAAKNVLQPSFKNLELISKWVSSNSKKFNDVFIRAVGSIQYRYKRKDIHKLNKRKLFRKIYKLIKDKKEYSIADALSYYSQDLEQFGWKGSETMLLIVGDVNYVKNGISSHGKYLNSFWLSSKNSPFVRLFMSRDNTVAKNTSVVIYTRTQLALLDEKKREDFLVNLFSHEDVGMDVYYIGDFHNNFMLPLKKENDTYSLKLLDKVRKKKLKPIPVRQLPETNICQIIGNGESILCRDCGKNR